MKRGRRVKKKRLLLSLCIIIALCISGCWNYSEINDRRIISGAAVDYNKEKDMIELTVELVMPISVGGKMQMKSESFSGLGDNLFNAVRNLISKTGKKIFWSHAKVLILSEDIIKEKEKFLSVIDFIKRDAETRDDMMLLVSREKTAKDILKTDVKVQEIISFHLEDMLKNQKSISKYRAVPLWKFVDELSSEGISATLPTINIAEYNKKKISQIYGTAIFKGAEKVGWLNGIETKSFLFVIDELKGGTLVTVATNLAKEPVKITFEIFKNKTKVKPIYKDGKIAMKIDIKTMVNINEIDSSLDFMNEENLKRIQRSGEDTIKKMVGNVIKKVQEEYKSDIFGFGAIISRENPKLWEGIKSNWEDIFTKLDVDVNVNLNIRGSALRSKTIKIGD
ncbi:Ger(x)C family spore germination protein [Paramaledivibacter caminithermalis]|uniref:Ger(x)C family spore germination protein n=1 Tax=Paramaledivibacter caminithermalis TaxID=191027 RepID=UPI0013F4E403|nr:Ger(x)C family spore germination protein [Paramaledivibacter caminithermalis]